MKLTAASASALAEAKAAEVMASEQNAALEELRSKVDAQAKEVRQLTQQLSTELEKRSVSSKHTRAF